MSEEGLGMFICGDSTHRLHEGVPRFPLLRQDSTALRGHAVEAAASLVRLFYPRPLDPSTLFEAIQQGIQGVEMEVQLTAGALADQLAQLVPVPGSSVEQRQDQEFGRSAFQFAIERAGVDTGHGQIPVMNRY